MFDNSALKLFTKKYLSLFLLTAVLIATSWSLLYKGLGFGHDLNHQARVFEMANGLVDGNFPVIWSKNLAYGYGMPLFEFYAPLPYFIGALFYIAGLNLTYSVEAIVLLANIFTIIGGYLLAKNLFKDKWAAVLVASVIALAPYRAVDLFVRTAISEAFAITFLPYVLLGIIWIVENKKFGWLMMSFSFAGLVLSHNLTALMSLPFLIAFAIFYLLLKAKFWQDGLAKMWRLLISGILGLGITAFYFIPALLEKDFTKINEFTLSSYYNFHQHFLYIRQFFEPWGAWEYGGSGWGPNDEMSYFLGFAQLAIIVFAIIQLVWFSSKLKKFKNLKNALLMQLSFLILIAASLVLTLLKVEKLWELFSFTVYFQFPWRLLSVTLVFIGLLAGSSYLFLQKKHRLIYFSIIFSLLVIFNTRYFQSEKYVDYSAKYQDYASYIRSETSNNLYDYIPKDVSFFEKVGFYLYKNPKFLALNAPATSIFSSEFKTSFQPNLILDNSTKKEFSVSLPNEQNISLNIAYYPGWMVSSNGKNILLKADENGLVNFTLPSGEQNATIQFKDTPVRFWSKIISVLSLIFTAVIIYLNAKHLSSSPLRLRQSKKHSTR